MLVDISQSGMAYVDVIDNDIHRKDQLLRTTCNTVTFDKDNFTLDVS